MKITKIYIVIKDILVSDKPDQLQARSWSGTLLLIHQECCVSDRLDIRVQEGGGSAK